MSRVLIILLLLAGRPVCAQLLPGLNKDSLRKVLAAQPPSDTARVATLILLGQQFEDTQPDSAISYYNEAGSLSRRLDYTAGILRYINNYTAVLNMRGQYDESLRLNLEGVKLASSHGLAAAYTKALVNTGVVYQYKQEYAQAVEYYLKALPQLEVEKNSQSLSLLYGNLCGLYRDLNQPEKALVYARSSLQLAEKEHNLFTTGAACINIGNVLKDLGRTREGLQYVQRAYDIGRQIPDSNLQETALIDIGDGYTQLSDPGRYIPAFQAALPLARALDDASGQAYALQGLAQGMYWKGRYAAAGALLHDEAIPFARDHGQREVWRNLLLLMSDVQIALGHPRSAQDYRSQYDSVSQALVNATMLKNIQELETKYKVERQQHDLLLKDLQLEQKDKQALRQRTWLITAVGGALLLAALFVGSWLFFRQRQQLHLRAIRTLQTEQENVRLRATLDGQLAERQRISQEMHDDMGSGLTSLLFLSRKLRYSDAASSPTVAPLSPGPIIEPSPASILKKIEHTAEQMIRKMNEIIWTLNHEQDTLDSLVSYIRSNAAEALENAGIDVRFHIDEALPARAVSQEFRRNVYLAVKEAVHNLIRHSGAGSADIHVHAGETLTIIVEDDGKGIDGVARVDHKARVDHGALVDGMAHAVGGGPIDPAVHAGGHRGNGLKNMRRRMEQIGGRFEIISERGARVILTAPL